jgi:hypothetical protein
MNLDREIVSPGGEMSSCSSEWDLSAGKPVSKRSLGRRASELQQRWLVGTDRPSAVDFVAAYR